MEKDRVLPINVQFGGLRHFSARRSESLCQLGMIMAALAYFTISITILVLGDPIDLSKLPALTSHCANVAPIPASEFHQRQQLLAEALYKMNASAYIAEPSASALYFANISDSSWHLSERPLLLLVSPQVTDDGAVSAKTSILTPTFEATRAKFLPIPADNVSFHEWPEDVNPYEVAVGSLPSFAEGDKIYVDENTRHFIVDGIQKAAPRSQILLAPVEIRDLRQRKSAAELEIMKCANEVTLLAIRAVRDNLHIGIRESEARAMAENALTAAGLKGLSLIVLFGENAALPHGSGTDRQLGSSDFILIDCGGSLHGYESDVTRVCLPFRSFIMHYLKFVMSCLPSRRCMKTFLLTKSKVSTQNLALWYIVRAAQSRAVRTAHAGVLTRTVDEAAREPIDAAGYGKYFTHRLGHGIGLEVHESPYLRGGSDDIIQTGHTFSDEPGIYIEGEVGVRLEDCFYIDEDGDSVYLTQGVGGQAESPWNP
ncbi:hypothetical protein EW146_g973 [Bondarzewia mesenterica]|uniref:Peptidase M24 domain-containing protein n=1 Tax=Bondarzewia mesenterica TaxID=1095465 RepID=A0A4S4M6Q0_9AGAM|nr:hypothetical protein EW146_g973 [Bondarzewia mesenterica]